MTSVGEVHRLWRSDSRSETVLAVATVTFWFIMLFLRSRRSNGGEMAR